MKTGEIVMIVILSILALTSWVIAYFQHKQRGFLFNNAYLYASKEERRRMNKTPYYKQSKVVFILVGFTFLTVALQIALHWSDLFGITLILTITMLVYAIVSSVKIYRNSRH